MMEYKVYKWSDVLTIINGRNQNAVECEDGEYPIYGSGGVMGKANDYLCPPNCTIIGRKGNINKPIYVETKFWNVDTAFGLSANEEILNPRYLYYFCVDYNFERHNKAVTIPSLTKADLLKIEMCLPPLDKQKSIVGELDKINELIRLKKEQLKDYDNLAQSIFYEMFGDPVVNEKGWEVKRITDLCVEISAGGDASKHEIKKTKDEIFYVPVYSNGIDKDGLYGYSNHATIIQPAITLAARGTIGAAFIRTEPYIPIIRLVSVIPDLSKISLTYLFYILKQTEWDRTGGTIPQLPVPKVKQLTLPLPPLPLQQLFAQRIELIEQQKAEIQSTIADLETLLASRMQYWFD